MDLETAEWLADQIAGVEQGAAQAIRDLVAEVRRYESNTFVQESLAELARMCLERDEARRQLEVLRKPLVFIGDTQAEHPAVDELRAKLAEMEANALAAMTTASNAVQERRAAQAKLAVAVKALKSIEWATGSLWAQDCAREALAKIGGK